MQNTIDKNIELILSKSREVVQLHQSLTNSTLKTSGEFGPEYRWDPPLAEDAIRSFEKKFGLTLPDDYRAFLLNLGDGGMGSGYGVLNLEDTTKDYVVPDLRFSADHFSRPFLFSAAFGRKIKGKKPPEIRGRKTDSDFFEKNSDLFTQGALVISDLGCLSEILLVVSGSEKGNVWEVDFGDYYSIYPFETPDGSRICFLELYLYWLKFEIEDLQRAIQERTESWASLNENTEKITMVTKHITDLILLPPKLPNVREIEFKINQITSLKGLPDELPNLEYLYLSENQLTNLNYFPQFVPKLRSLHLNRNPFSSVNGLPKSMEMLEYLSLDRTKIENLIGIPENLPNLESFRITYTKIKNLEGFPREIGKKCNVEVYGNKLVSLYGVPRQYLINVFVGDIRPKNNFEWTLGEGFDKYRNRPNQCYYSQKGKKLIENCLEIIRQASPPYKLGDPEPPALAAALDAVYAYYEHPIQEIAERFLLNSTSLSSDDYERLLSESDEAILHRLEAKLGSEDLTVQSIRMNQERLH